MKRINSIAWMLISFVVMLTNIYYLRIEVTERIMESDFWHYAWIYFFVVAIGICALSTIVFSVLATRIDTPPANPHPEHEMD